MTLGTRVLGNLSCWTHLATGAASPASIEIQPRYTTLRLRNIQEGSGGDGSSVYRAGLFPPSKKPNHDTGGTSFHFYYTGSPAASSLPFHVLVTRYHSFSEEGRITHQRSELEELDDNNNQRKKLPRKYVQYDMKKHCVGDETQADHRSRSYQEERGRGNIYEAGRKKRVSTERIYPERLPRCLVALCTCVRSRWWCLSLQSFSMNEIGARFTVLSMEYRCRGGGSTIRSVDPCARRA